MSMNFMNPNQPQPPAQNDVQNIDPNLFNINFEGVQEAEESSYRVLKEGLILVQILKMSAGLSKEKNTPYIRMNLQIMKGEDKGYIFDEDIYITDGCKNNILAMYSRVLGEKPQNTNIINDIPRFIGRTFVASIIQESYQNKEGKIKYKNKINYGGFYQATSYKDEYDNQRKHSISYTQYLEKPPEPTAQTGTGFGGAF